MNNRKFEQKDYEARKEEKKEWHRLIGEDHGDGESLRRSIAKIKRSFAHDESWDEAEESAREDAECAYVNTRHKWHKEDLDNEDNE